MLRQDNCGEFGEFMGECWLEAQGYTILERNWRSGRLELDRITFKDGILHVIEIKSRTNTNYGWPEEAITARKLKNLRIATLSYLREHPIQSKYQIDVLAINIHPMEVDFLLFEDVG